MSNPFALLILLSVASLARPQADADEQYRFLAGLVEKGLDARAVDEARAFLRDHPRHAKAALARYRLADALWRLERHDEAEREYDTLARLQGFEYRAEALFRCGEAARERGASERARAAFESVRVAGQSYLVAPALLALAELDLAADHMEEAEQRYAEILREHPDSEEAARARHGLVWCAWRRGDAAETIARARGQLAEERDPGRRDALSLLLGEALLANDPGAALEAFRAVQTPEQREARMRGEGFALAAQGEHRAAAEAFERLLERAPEGHFAPEAVLQAGVERLRSGDTPAAIAHLTRAALRDGAPETLYWLARAQREAGDGTAALATLEHALAVAPVGELAGRLEVLRGDCLADVGRTDEARSAYERSGSDVALHAAAVQALNAGDAVGAERLARQLLRDPASEVRAQGARVVLAEALFASARYPEAERALDAALNRPADAGEEARLLSRRAWCRYLATDLAGAQERFAALAGRADEAPECEEAQAMLVRIARERGASEDEQREAQRYLERYPRGRFADTCALAATRTAEPAERRRRLERWLARFAESPLRAGALLELAELDEGAGDAAAAARHYAEVQSVAPATPEAARAAYGLAWSAFQRKDLEAAERALAELEREPAADPALVESAAELWVWTRAGRGDLQGATQRWRALAALGGAEDRRLSAARRVIGALREEQRLDVASALLAECRGMLKTPALVAELELESTYLALESQDGAGAAKALERARRAGASPGAVAEAGFHLGEARQAAGDLPGALEAWSHAAEVENPRAADALYRLGFAQLSRGDLADAERAFTQLLSEHPRSMLAPEAAFLNGECAYRGERFEEACRRLQTAREAQGAGPVGDGSGADLKGRILFRLGLAHGRLGRWQECEACLTELARVAPSFPNLAEAELWRGRALLAQGRSRPARAAFERALALDAGEIAAAARLGLGQVAEREGRLDDALSEFLKVALLYAHEDSVCEALLGAGRVLEAQGSGEQAAARYAELVREHPSSPFTAQARERLRTLEKGPQ